MPAAFIHSTLTPVATTFVGRIEGFLTGSRIFFATGLIVF
jgi:hypothetical protein